MSHSPMRRCCLTIKPCCSRACLAVRVLRYKLEKGLRAVYCGGTIHHRAVPVWQRKRKGEAAQKDVIWPWGDDDFDQNTWLDWWNIKIKMMNQTFEQNRYFLLVDSGPWFAQFQRWLEWAWATVNLSWRSSVEKLLFMAKELFGKSQKCNCSVSSAHLSPITYQ